MPIKKLIFLSAHSYELTIISSFQHSKFLLHFSIDVFSLLSTDIQELYKHFQTASGRQHFWFFLVLFFGFFFL